MVGLRDDFSLLMYAQLLHVPIGERRTEKRDGKKRNWKREMAKSCGGSAESAIGKGKNVINVIIQFYFPVDL